MFVYIIEMIYRRITNCVMIRGRKEREYALPSVKFYVYIRMVEIVYTYICMIYNFFYILSSYKLYNRGEEGECELWVRWRGDGKGRVRVSKSVWLVAFPLSPSLSLFARLHRERTAGMRMSRLRDDPLPREGAPPVSANRIRD